MRTSKVNTKHKALSTRVYQRNEVQDLRLQSASEGTTQELLSMKTWTWILQKKFFYYYLGSATQIFPPKSFASLSSGKPISRLALGH